MSSSEAAQYSYQEAHASDTWIPNLLAAGIITLTAAYISVALRFCSRKSGKCRFGKDDISIVVALFWATVFTVFILVLTRYGFGKHELIQSRGNLEIQGSSFVAVLAILPVATFFVKLSILALYYRIFRTIRWFRIVLWTTGIFILLETIANVFATIFKCVPVGAEESNRPHHCVNQDLLFAFFSFLNSVLDFWILLLPLPLVWNLHTSLKRRLQITAVFCLGLLACAASLVRSVFSLTTNDLDATFDDAPAMMWSIVEINISIVSACLLTFKPLLNFLAERHSQFSARYLSGRNFRPDFTRWGSSNKTLSDAPTMRSPSDNSFELEKPSMPQDA